MTNEMTEEEIKQAARNLCVLRGIPPDKLVDMMGRRVVANNINQATIEIANQPQPHWCFLVPEIKAGIARMQVSDAIRGCYNDNAVINGDEWFRQIGRALKRPIDHTEFTAIGDNDD